MKQGFMRWLVGFFFFVKSKQLFICLLFSPLDVFSAFPIKKKNTFKRTPIPFSPPYMIFADQLYALKGVFLLIFLSVMTGMIFFLFPGNPKFIHGWEHKIPKSRQTQATGGKNCEKAGKLPRLFGDIIQ